MTKVGHPGGLDGAVRLVHPGPRLCQGSFLLRGGFWQLIVEARLESNCSGVATQPTQPPLPPEASRDPIHLGWLRAT